MDQVSFPIRYACVYTVIYHIHNTPEHLTYSLCTAAPSSQSIRKGGSCTQAIAYGLRSYPTVFFLCKCHYCSSSHNIFTLKIPYACKPLFQELLPWTLFHDFHSNTTLMNDMEIVLKFQWLQEPTMLRYWVQRYSHSKGELINMMQLVLRYFFHYRNGKSIRKVNKQII